MKFSSKKLFFIKNVDFSLEKCRFGTKKGVSHYVLRRKRVIFQKNDNFELEICAKPHGGRAARCMGTPPVAEMLASEARRDRMSGHVRARQSRVRRPLSMPFAGDRSRESCGTWQLPQMNCSKSASAPASAQSESRSNLLDNPTSNFHRRTSCTSSL